MNNERAIFTLRIAGKAGQAGIRDLRALMKIARRRFGLIVIDAREDAGEAPDTANVHAQFLELIRSITSAK